jgi:hypothetical protein
MMVNDISMRASMHLAALGAIFLFIPACSNAPQGWSTYRDEKGRFEVSYPANWYLKPHPGRLLVTNTQREVNLASGGGLFSSGGTVFVVEVLPTKQITSVRQLNSANARWETMKLGAFEGETLRGSVSWQMGLEFLHNGALHRLTCASESPQQQEKIVETCNRMLLSVKIL